MKTLFAVPWIEVEYGWGDRPEGFKVFETEEECIKQTNLDSADGNYDGGYFGPVRPLCYYKTPDEIEGPFPRFVKDLTFKSDLEYINL